MKFIVIFFIYLKNILTELNRSHLGQVRSNFIVYKNFILKRNYFFKRVAHGILYLTRKKYANYFIGEFEKKKLGTCPASSKV